LAAYLATEKSCIFTTSIKNQKERIKMRNLLITTAVTTVLANAVYAEGTPAPTGPTLSGELSIGFAETAAGDWGATTGVDLGINAAGMASVDLDFSTSDGNAVVLDNWTVGTTVGALAMQIGDDNGLMPGAEGEQTLAAPAMAESIQVTMGVASVAIGFTDYTSDITDVSNVQGSLSLGSFAGMGITAAGDYNLDSENIVVGAGVNGVDLGVASLGGALTYDVDAETAGYELVANAFGAVGYLNGDSDDALQNVGAEYVYGFGGADITGGASYNLNSEELSPTIKLSFNF